MKTRFTLSIVLAMLALITSCQSPPVSNESTMSEVVVEALDFASQQSLLMAQSLLDQPEKLPKTTDRFGNLETCNSDWWTSGFFPGQLWYMYEYTNGADFLTHAKNFTKRVEKQQYTTDNHDVGFMIFCSYGNGFRLTQDTSYLSVIENASKSLSTRFNDKTGCIQSWGSNDRWQYPVIIDNMMNLELLLWSAERFKTERFAEIANTHANTTIKNHYRPDYSSYHVVSYDTLTGAVQVKNTAQGYSDDSAWGRGQAWGLYGYVMMYRMTSDKKYLEQAISIANFLIDHPNLPEDGIPYWDFNAPNIPDCNRDASAGAIISSALIELSQYTDQYNSKFLDMAETQLRSLSSPIYRNALANNGNFILKNSVGHMPAGTEIDVPLSYADYYYVEALMRYKKLKEI